MKHHLIHKKKKKVIDEITSFLLTHEGTSSAYLFGSFVSSEGFSDIDIGILTKEDLNQPLDFELEMESRLERMIKYPVDVRVLNRAPISFCQNVFRTGMVILERDPNLRADFESRILKKYFDFLPFHRRYLQEVINAPI